jgi:lysophospholipase L1-like esterase
VLIAGALLLLSQAEPLPETVVPVKKADIGSQTWLGGRTWMDQHRDILEIGLRRSPDLVLFGDSLMQNWAGEGRRVRRAVRQADFDLYFGIYNSANFGVSGDGTQHLLWRINNGAFNNVNPKLIIIHIGVNNTDNSTGEEIAAGVKAVVQRLRRVKPDSKLLILSPIPAGEKPDDWRRLKLDRATEIMSRFADKSDIFYADIRADFLDEDGKLDTKDYSSDWIHLSKRGFAKMGEAMALPVRTLMRF